MGVAVSPTYIMVKNTAAVMVTATLPAFAQPGMKIDFTTAAIGDAHNLQGGILVLTSLRGADGQVYAVAQGPVVTGGFAAGRGEGWRRHHECRRPGPTETCISIAARLSEWGPAFVATYRAGPRPTRAARPPK